MQKKELFYILIIIIYMVLTLTCVLHHESWTDEAQVWQLCTYLSVPDLLKQLHIEGHPPLFYFCVFPFAKLFSNIIFLQLICWFVMVISAYLLLFYSPFKLYTKCAILLSAGFFYFFPVVARNYSFIPILLFLTALLYSKSKQHPFLYSVLLALIANIHIIMLCFAFLLFIDFVWTNILKNLNKDKVHLVKYIISALIPFAAIIFVIFQLHDTTDISYYLSFKYNDILTNLLNVPCYFIFSTFDNDIIDLNLKSWEIPFLLVVFILNIVIMILLYKKSKKMFLIAFLSIFAQFFIYISVFTYLTTWRIFVIYVILIFCFWIILENQEIPSKTINCILSVFFLLTSYNGIYHYIKDIKYEYSSAKSTAQWIKTNLNPENSILMTVNEPQSVALAYYLENSPFYIMSMVRNQKLKYVIWDNKTNLNFSAENYKEYLSLKNYNKDVYIIRIASYDKNSDFPTHNSFVKVFASEEFVIYKFISE